MTDKPDLSLAAIDAVIAKLENPTEGWSGDALCTYQPKPPRKPPP